MYPLCSHLCICKCTSVVMHQREMSSAVPQIRPFINDLNEKLENSSKSQNREIQNPIFG